MCEKRLRYAGHAVLLLGVAFYAVVLLRTAWLCDDAYITLRTVDNFVNGHGLRWNVDERVQVYTHPLWMFLLSAVYAVTREEFLTTIAVSVAVSTGAVAMLLFGAARGLFWPWLALAVLVFSQAFVDYSTSGLENPLTHLLLATFAGVYLYRPMTAKRLFVLSLVAGLGVLNRMDTLLLFAPALALAWWQGPRLRGLPALAAGFLPFAGWMAFSVVYYGFPFPNTAYAKLGTGLERAELVRQGGWYVYHTWMRDPLTLLAIVAALLLAPLRRNRRALALSCGILLYVVYVVGIGGDFMGGRFFAAPLLMAVAVLTCWEPEAREAWRVNSVRVAMAVSRLAPAALAVVVFAAVVWLGLGRPWPASVAKDAGAAWTRTVPTVFSSADFGNAVANFKDPHGIGDERRFYYADTGLLRYTREKPGVNPDNRFVREGRNHRAEGREMVQRHGSVGFRGFFAGPKVHIVDYYALCDPLLARLPAAYNPRWRIGHFTRRMPAGYFETVVNLQMDPPNFDAGPALVSGMPWAWPLWSEAVRMFSGHYDDPDNPEDEMPRLVQNVMEDENLARYYGQLALVTRGPLWSRGRWVAIWRLNTGYYDHLVDRDALRFPDLYRISADQVAGPAEPGAQDGGVPIPGRGLHVGLGESHAGALSVALDGAGRYEVLLMRGADVVARQKLGPSASGCRGFAVYGMRVPAAVADAGYDGLRIFPDDARREGRLGHVRPVNGGAP